MKNIDIPLTGGQCTGKGTLGPRLASTFGGLHLSVGDILRAEADKHADRKVFTSVYQKSRYGELTAEERAALDGQYITKLMKDGELVPDEMVLPLLEERLKQEFKKGVRKVWLDGFPRTGSQLLLFRGRFVRFSFLFFSSISAMYHHQISSGRAVPRVYD